MPGADAGPENQDILREVSEMHVEDRSVLRQHDTHGKGCKPHRQHQRDQRSEVGVPNSLVGRLSVKYQLPNGL